MSIFKSMTGMVRIKITCADPARLITELNNASVALYDISWEDALTVCGTLPRPHYATAKRLIIKRNGQVQLLQRKGLYWGGSGLLHRPLLLLGLIGILFLTLYLPSRVLFVYVEGNESIPTRLILEKAQGCGICFGASRSQVRSERIKNMLLSEIPQLQWAGVNTSGCVATITVRERNIADVKEEFTGVSSIVAARDGIIQQMTVTKGNPLCQVGQAVKAGQTLVSGYTDCGISIKVSQAEAEVYALTHRSVKVAAITKTMQKTQIVDRLQNRYLLIGDTRIQIPGSETPVEKEGFFWQKTRTETVLTLPGDLPLPVSMIVEEYVCYEITLQENTYGDDDLLKYAKKYLLTHMVSGRIISAAHQLPEEQEYGLMQAEFSCIEMIGKVQQEHPVGIKNNRQ